jgi:hypothetical protein
LFDVLAPGNCLLPVVLLWAWGYDGFVVVNLLCQAEQVIASGGIKLGEYGKCIMHFGVGFWIEYFFSFTITCHRNSFVIIVLSILQCPRTPSIIS